MRTVQNDSGLLAQLVEQRTLNPLVVCSNHTQPTTEHKELDENLAPFLLSTIRPPREAPSPLGVRKANWYW